MTTIESNKQLEQDTFLRSVFEQFGYDFNQYSPSMLARRLNRLKLLLNTREFSEIVLKLKHNPSIINQIKNTLSIPVTEFFRTPRFFQYFRHCIVPFLSTYPYIKIWSAGCATGEEAFSLAILLKETGLLSKSRIYATDFNESVLNRALQGGYEIESLAQAKNNYLKSGGVNSFVNYCRLSHNKFIMSEELRNRVTFASHNLVHDEVFSEVQVVCCRNVLIYFNSVLKEHCMELFSESLVSRGFLCLGEHETVESLKAIGLFTPESIGFNIYRTLARN